MLNEESLIFKLWAGLNNLMSGLLTKLIVALVVIFIGFIIGRILNKIIVRFLHEIGLNEILKKATDVEMDIETLSGNLAMYFIYFIAFIMALNQLGLTTTILNMISGAIIVIIIISIFLALKDFVPNIFAGIFIYRKKFIRIGDIIKFKGIEGKVIKIDLLETKVETQNKDLLLIPNAALTKTEVIKVKGVQAEKRKRKK